MVYVDDLAANNRGFIAEIAALNQVIETGWIAVYLRKLALEVMNN